MFIKTLKVLAVLFAVLGSMVLLSAAISDGDGVIETTGVLILVLLLGFVYLRYNL